MNDVKTHTESSMWMSGNAWIEFYLFFCVVSDLFLTMFLAQLGIKGAFEASYCPGWGERLF